MDTASVTSDLTAFDIGVLIIVGLSTIMAFSRGFATVALSLAAWAASFIIAVFGFTFFRPYGRDLISNEALADIVTLVGVFIVVLMVLKLVAGMIGKSVKESPLGFLDRSLGALFGLLRGMVIVSLLYMGVSVFFIADKMPDWVKSAKLRPMVAWSAEMMKEFAEDLLDRHDPSDTERMLREAAAKSQFNSEAAEEAAGVLYRGLKDPVGDLIENQLLEAKKNDSNDSKKDE